MLQTLREKCYFKILDEENPDDKSGIHSEWYFYMIGMRASHDEILTHETSKKVLEGLGVTNFRIA